MQTIARWRLVMPLLVAFAAASCAPGEPAATQSPEVGSSPTSPSTPSPSPTDLSRFRGQTLSYVYFTDGPDEQATRALIAKFEEASGAKVDLQIVPYGDLDNVLQARIAGGNAPEAARLSNLVPYMDELLDLSRYFGPDYAGQFVTGMVNAAKGPNGELLAVPSDMTMNGPFVNVDQFQKAGVPLPSLDKPWTFDEMIAAAEKVQAANGTPYAMTMDLSGHRISTIFSWFGTTMIGTDGKLAFDPTKAERAMAALTDLIKNDKISKDFWLQAGSKYKGGNEIFLAGAAPLYLSGNWQVSALSKDAPFAWAAVPNPCVERCGGFPGGKFMGAFKNSKNPELGAAFVEWMNRRENQEFFDQQSLFLPTRADLIEAGITYPERSDDMAVFIADTARTPEDTYATVFAGGCAAQGAEAGYKAIRSESQRVVAGEVDAATAVANIRKAIADAISACN